MPCTDPNAKLNARLPAIPPSERTPRKAENQYHDYGLNQRPVAPVQIGPSLPGKALRPHTDGLVGKVREQNAASRRSRETYSPQGHGSKSTGVRGPGS